MTFLAKERQEGTHRLHRTFYNLFCGVEKCQARSARAQRNHIGCAIRAFLRLEIHSFNIGHSWFEAKMEIIREAIRHYLEKPKYTLSPTTW